MANHRKIIGVYTSLILICSSILGSYVACGAQNYRIAVDNDTPNEKMAAAGTSSLSGAHSSKGWGSNMPIPYKMSTGINSEQIAQITRAMETWNAAVGKKLFSYQGIEQKVGADFDSLYAPLNDFVNGNYFDTKWQEKTGKSTSVLATTIWENSVKDTSIISRSDIRYNVEYYVLGDSLKDISAGEKIIVDLESLALHELGHLIGLSHISAEKDRYSVMNPALFIGEGMITRRISTGDIERIRSIYGTGDATLANNLEIADDFPTNN